MAVDTNRKTLPARAVGRVLSGQDRYEKEAQEGTAESHLASRRREQLAERLLGPSGKGGFAERLQQKADADKPRKP